MKISVVIPCYRSVATLPAVVQETIQVLQQRPENDYEIILVDDGSPDDTLETIRTLCANKKVKGIALARNFGQPCARLAVQQPKCGARPKMFASGPLLV